MKNKIQYVRVTGCNEDNGQMWYCESIGVIFPVIEHNENYYLLSSDHHKTGCRFIAINDCQPVQIKELDKDIDGNYLECGDEVKILDKTQEGLPIGNRVFLYKKNGRYYTDQVQDQGEYFTCCAYEKVRKITKEEKKVDPIEEVWNKYKDDIKEIIAANPWQYNLCEYSFDWVKTLAAAIKQHMEDKKG